MVGSVHGTMNKDWLAERTPKPGAGHVLVAADAEFAMKQRNGPLPPPAAEFEVYAGADNVLVERDRGVGAAAIGEAAGRVGKIDEKVFGLGGPVRRKGIFETDAGGPARLRGVHERKRAGGSLDIGKRSAGGAIEKNAVPGPTGAAAHGGEPIALRRAADKRA